MSIRVRCPSCSSVESVAPENRGRTVSCSACGTALRVPESKPPIAKGVAPPNVAPAAPRKPAAARPAKPKPAVANGPAPAFDVCSATPHPPQRLGRGKIAPMLIVAALAGAGLLVVAAVGVAVVFLSFPPPAERVAVNDPPQSVPAGDGLPAGKLPAVEDSLGGDSFAINPSPQDEAAPQGHKLPGIPMPDPHDEPQDASPPPQEEFTINVTPEGQSGPPSSSSENPPNRPIAKRPSGDAAPRPRIPRPTIPRPAPPDRRPSPKLPPGAPRPGPAATPKPDSTTGGDDATGIGGQIDARDLGLVLPKQNVRAGTGRRVLVKNQQGEVKVGKVHVEADDRVVVMLPTGKLISVRPREATDTERPFQPATQGELIDRLKTEQFRGFKDGSTKRYVYIYNTSEPFYTATHTILETMYPKLVTFCENLGLRVRDPDVPMVVIMFRTDEEYQQFRKMPSGVVAYYDIVSNHIVMYEQSKLAEVAPALAIKQSISTIAHEGVHQIFHNIGVQQRLSDWPMWLGEGVPEYCAPTHTDRRVRWKGVGTVNDLRMYSLAELLKSQGRSLSEGRLVERTVRSSNLDSGGYATAWALTYHLAKNRTREFRDYIQDVSRLQPLQDDVDHEAVFTRHFGDDFATLQQQMLTSLKGLPYQDPVANQPHFMALLDTPLRRSTMVTTSPASIRRWHDQLVSTLPAGERSRAKLRVQVYANRASAKQAAAAALR